MVSGPMRLASLRLAALLGASPAQARDTALLLAIDVSNPTDSGEFDIRACSRAEAQGIAINALAIGSIGRVLTHYDRLKVITRNGFVMTAQGHSTYAATLKAKIRREIAQAMF